MSYSSGQRGQTVNLLAFAFRGSNPRLITIAFCDAGIAQLARASAFQAEGREFESRFPLHVVIPDWELFLLLLQLPLIGSLDLVVCKVVCSTFAMYVLLIWLRGRALPW